MTQQKQKPGTTQIMERIVLGHAGVILAFLLVVMLVVLVWQTPPKLPDFSAIDEIPVRKEAFFEYLAPVVETENQRILEQRQRLLAMTDGIRNRESFGWLDRRWLGNLAEEYKVAWQTDISKNKQMELIETLERRVDTVPVSLALAQAATESGWGRSRFARQGNNLFGHWCFETGCGLVPAQRSQSAVHEVAAFDSVSDSVARYLHNLNTHEAYAPLRAIRARLRQQGEPLTAMALADGLARYSERREDYVEEIKSVIRVNLPIIEQVQEAL